MQEPLKLKIPAEASDQTPGNPSWKEKKKHISLHRLIIQTLAISVAAGSKAGGQLMPPSSRHPRALPPAAVRSWGCWLRLVSPRSAPPCQNTTLRLRARQAGCAPAPSPDPPKSRELYFGDADGRSHPPKQSAGSWIAPPARLVCQRATAPGRDGGDINDGDGFEGVWR